MHKIKSHLLAAGIALLPFLFPLEVRSATFSQVYVFGDSLSDTGNVYRRTLRLYPRSPYYRGRFSNGLVWTEYVAQGLGLEAERADNFAHGGTTSGEGDAVSFPLLEFPGLQKQVRNFVEDNPAADPNALYLVWSGANDYLGGNVTNPRIPPRNLVKAVTTLANAGARTILVGNLPDLGRLPSTRQTAESTELNRLSNQHNSNLSRFIRQLDRTLDPQVDLLTLDVDSLFAEVRSNPASYGFRNVTRDCLSVSACRSNPRLQSKFLFWDDIHPTTAGHQQIAQLALDLLDVQPGSTRTALLQAQSVDEAPQPIALARKTAPSTVPEPASAIGLAAIALLGIRLRRNPLQRNPQRERQTS